MKKNKIEDEINKLKSIPCKKEKDKIRMNEILLILESQLLKINTFSNEKINNFKLIGGAEKEQDEEKEEGEKTKHLNVFILKLSEFEMIIRQMKTNRNEVKKLIRKYNIRYTQFFNFQKYIVNYVSLVLAQEEYGYWQLMSREKIQHYKNILSELEINIDKFENPSLYKDRNTFMTEENIWFYSKHFFLIKILKKFLTELDEFWGKSLKNLLNNKIDTLANKSSNSPNKTYFFLFNIFFRILDAFEMKNNSNTKNNENNNEDVKIKTNENIIITPEQNKMIKDVAKNLANNENNNDEVKIQTNENNNEDVKIKTNENIIITPEQEKMIKDEAIKLAERRPLYPVTPKKKETKVENEEDCESDKGRVACRARNLEQKIKVNPNIKK
jgi:hypothetical protein